MSLCFEAWWWDTLRAGKPFLVMLPPPSCGACSKRVPGSGQRDTLHRVSAWPARLCASLLHFSLSPPPPKSQSEFS